MTLTGTLDGSACAARLKNLTRWLELTVRDRGELRLHTRDGGSRSPVDRPFAVQTAATADRKGLAALDRLGFAVVRLTLPAGRATRLGTISGDKT